jgi:hypothetical protein
MPLLLALVALVITIAPLRSAEAQPPAAGATQPLVGSWQGAVTAGPNTFRIGMVVTTTASGVEAYLVSIDQDSSRLPVGQITLSGSDVRLDLPAIGGNYAGTFSADGSEIVGTLTQGMPLALGLTSSTHHSPSPTLQTPRSARSSPDTSTRSLRRTGTRSARWSLFRSRSGM